MSLYTIQAKYIDLANRIEEAGGVVDEEILKELEVNDEEFEEKISQWLHVINEKRGKSKMLKDEVSRLTDRKKAVDKSIEQMENAVDRALKQREMDKYDNGLYTVSYHKSSFVNDENMTTIPPDYLKTKTTETLDKAGIKKALKKGEEFEGIFLDTRQHLQIK